MKYRYAIVFHTAVCLAGPGASLASGPIQLLPNDNAIPAALATTELRSPGPWWAITITADGMQRADRVDITFSRPQCPLPNQVNCEETQKIVSLTQKPIVPDSGFLVRGKDMEPGPMVNTGRNFPVSLLPIGLPHGIQLGQLKYSVTMKGQMAGELPENAQLILSQGEKHQTLWDFKKEALYGWDDPSFEVLWAGDIDRDARLDLFIKLAPKYSFHVYRLYLSTHASTGGLVGQAGEYTLSD